MTEFKTVCLSLDETNKKIVYLLNSNVYKVLLKARLYA